MARTFNEGINAVIALHEAEIAQQRAIFAQHMTKQKAEGRTLRWKEFRFHTLNAIDYHQRWVQTLQSLKEAE